MGREYSDNIQVLSFWLTEKLIWANEFKADKRYELVSKKKKNSELTKEAWIRQLQICSIEEIGELSQTETYPKENREGCERSLTNYKAVWGKGG